MRNKGQMIETNMKLDRWIKVNIDKLYQDKDLRKIFYDDVKKMKTKNIDELLYERSSLH